MTSRSIFDEIATKDPSRKSERAKFMKPTVAAPPPAARASACKKPKGSEHQRAYLHLGTRTSRRRDRENVSAARRSCGGRTCKRKSPSLQFSASNLLWKHARALNQRNDSRYTLRSMRRRDGGRQRHSCWMRSRYQAFRKGECRDRDLCRTRVLRRRGQLGPTPRT